MPNTNLEITQNAMEDFIRIQEYMMLAKEENAVCRGIGTSMMFSL